MSKPMEVSSVIRAQRIELVGPTGETRAVFSAEDDKEWNVFLAFCDRSGATRLAVGVSVNGPDLVFYDEQGNEVFPLPKKSK